jgi:hypothetical protein
MNLLYALDHLNRDQQASLQVKPPFALLKNILQ